jgi:hypothetical protein
MMFWSTRPLLRASAPGWLHTGGGLAARGTRTARAFAFGGARCDAQPLAARAGRGAFGFAQSSAWPSFIHDQSLLDKYSSAAVLSGDGIGYFARPKKPPKR